MRPPPGNENVENFLVPGVFAVWLKDTGDNWHVLVPKGPEPGLPHWLLPVLWLTLMTIIIGCLAFWSTWRLLRPPKAIVSSVRRWHAEPDPGRLEKRGPPGFRALARATHHLQIGQEPCKARGRQ